MSKILLMLSMLTTLLFCQSCSNENNPKIKEIFMQQNLDPEVFDKSDVPVPDEDGYKVEINYPEYFIQSQWDGTVYANFDAKLIQIHKKVKDKNSKYFLECYYTYLIGKKEYSTSRTSDDYQKFEILEGTIKNHILKIGKLKGVDKIRIKYDVSEIPDIPVSSGYLSRESYFNRTSKNYNVSEIDIPIIIK